MDFSLFPKRHKKSFYLSRPRSLCVAGPKHFVLSLPPKFLPRFHLPCPQFRDENDKKLWRSLIKKGAKSSESYATKFLNDVNGMTKKVSQHKKHLLDLERKLKTYAEGSQRRIMNSKQKVKAQEIRIWGEEVGD